METFGKIEEEPAWNVQRIVLYIVTWKAVSKIDR